MSQATKGFLGMINPGVMLTPDVVQQIQAYESMDVERSKLKDELDRLRKKQEETEDSLAEALAEDELQCNLRGEAMTKPTEEELQDILKSHLSGIINSLAAKYEQLLFLDADIRKLKQTIEKGIVAANAVSAEEASSM
ncbi:hypothetical protein KR018_006323 [Drosophila ironensis]|nr:hypothetical protein KR018_006323 [Drosophila ironensis]